LIFSQVEDSKWSASAVAASTSIAVVDGEAVQVVPRLVSSRIPRCSWVSPGAVLGVEVRE
jgi:hypothetical protein